MEPLSKHGLKPNLSVLDLGRKHLTGSTQLGGKKDAKYIWPAILVWLLALTGRKIMKK